MTVLAVPIWLVRLAAHAAGVSLPLVATSVLTACITVAYFVWFWMREDGSTLGMRFLRLGMDPEAGSGPVGARAAFVRAVVLVVVLDVLYLPPAVVPTSQWSTTPLALVTLGWFVLLFGTMLTSPRRQSVHDRLARTVVIARSEASFARHLMALVLIAVYFAGTIWLALGPLKGV